VANSSEHDRKMYSILELLARCTDDFSLHLLTVRIRHGIFFWLAIIHTRVKAGRPLVPLSEKTLIWIQWVHFSSDAV